jgi:hypothetical protein
MVPIELVQLGDTVATKTVTGQPHAWRVDAKKGDAE